MQEEEDTYDSDDDEGDTARHRARGEHRAGFDVEADVAALDEVDPASPDAEADDAQTDENGERTAKRAKRDKPKGAALLPSPRFAPKPCVCLCFVSVLCALGCGLFFAFFF